MKKVLIKDLQTGEYSSFKTLDDIFESYVEDYAMHVDLGRDLTDEEEKKRMDALLDNFEGYTDEQKEAFLLNVYDFSIIHNPTPEQIAEYEEESGDDF